MSNIVIPSVQELRDRLASATTEARYLRRLLKIAKEREEAVRLSKASGAPAKSKEAASDE